MLMLMMISGKLQRSCFIKVVDGIASATLFHVRKMWHIRTPLCWQDHHQ